MEAAERVPRPTIADPSNSSDEVNACSNQVNRMRQVGELGRVVHAVCADRIAEPEAKLRADGRAAFVQDRLSPTTRAP